MNKTAAAVLAQLSTHADFISGAALAANIAVSRTAVWKAINALKAAGYAIESKPHVGYRLQPSDKLTKAAILAAANLPQTTPLSVFDQIASTNLYAKQTTFTHLPHIIVANEQTAGYGRFQRQFVSPDNGGVYLTLALSPKQAGHNPGVITTTAAVAVMQTIEETCGVTPHIKWVNDLYYKHKKVAGILCEGISDFESGQLQKIIVGIGVNLKTDVNSLPEELHAKVGTLKEPATTHNVNRNHFIGLIIKHFLALLQTPPATVMDAYRSHCSTINQNVTLQTPSQTITGTIATIDDNGWLVFTDGRKFAAGEITKTNVTLN